ncbi:MAG: AEC family transporter [Pseudomonadota bacterium]
MLAIFLETLPFFALIFCGWAASARGVFGPEAAALLTRFVFYFALSAMLFRLGATLPVAEVWNPDFLLAYLVATGVLYLGVLAVSRLRGEALAPAAFEAQVAVIGNVGFLGLPMLVALYGPAAALPVLIGLVVDLVIFGTLVVILVEAAGGGGGLAAVRKSLGGVARNPMILSIVCGLLWSAGGIALPGPVDRFLAILGAAATPCALFAIGCSLAQQSADQRRSVAAGLSAVKLVAHPAAVAVAMFWVFDVDPFLGAIAVAAAAMPVAGNVFILAQHYGVAAQRVSAAILVSTAVSVVTVSAVLALVAPGAG